MATKAQERAALKKIREIVEGLGENSYLSMAFDGCFQDAYENIEYYFGNSWKARAKYAQDECDRLRASVDEANEHYWKAKSRAEDAEKRLNMVQETADDWCARYHEKNDRVTALEAGVQVYENRIAGMEQEIMKLKARLYDLMTAGE